MRRTTPERNTFELARELRLTVSQLYDGERWVMTPTGDGGFILERPPLLSPAERRRWDLLYDIEAEARAQAERNVDR